MTTKLEKLMFRIGLIDKASAPLGKIDAQLQKMQRHAAGGGALLAGAAAGGWALQRAVSGMLGPSIAFESAMADVRKVVDFDTPKQFAQMRREIQDLSIQLPIAQEGLAAIVAAAGQSNIARQDLIAFTRDAARMGVAFDISADEAGETMAKFRTAFRLSQAEVVTLADQINYLGNTTAAGTGPITDIVRRVGALGDVAGLDSGSIAALGATMASVGVESEIGATGIKNLMLSLSAGSAATKAQRGALQALGLDARKLADSMQDDAAGAIVNVLRRLRELPQAQRAATLTQLFGRESVGAIAPLLTNLDALVGNLGKVGDPAQFSGSMLKEFIARADTTAAVLGLTKNAAQVAATELGSVLLPNVKSLAISVTEFLRKVIDWVRLFPNLTRVVGDVATGAAGLIAAVIALSTVGGVLRLTIAGLIPFKFLWIAVTKTAAAVQWLYSKALKAGRVAVLVYQLAHKPRLMAAWSLATRAAAASVRFLGTALRVAGMATLLFSAALWANPITWIVAGVVALIAGLYLLVKHWDSVKAATLGFFNAFAERWGALRDAIEGNPVLHFLFTPLLAGIDLITLLFKHLDKIPKWFAAFKSWLDGLGIFDVLGKAADWLIGKLNRIPGINIEAQVQDQRSQVPRAALPRFQTSAVPPGGISQEINNNQRGGLHIEKVELNQPVSGGNFVDELEMAAG